MDLNGTPGWQRYRGVAVLELAFTLIFLLLLTIGITEIGRGFWYYTSLQTAVRNSARCLSNLKWDSTESTTACMNLVPNAAVSAGIPGGNSIAPILTCSGTTCDWGSWGNGSAPEYVTVEVAYNMTWLWAIPGGSPQPGETAGLKMAATMPYMVDE